LKQKFSLVLLTGVLLSLGWPTFGSPIFLFVALLPLLEFVHNIKNSSLKNKIISVYSYSYFAFLFWNICTTWWIYNSSGFGATFAILCNSSFYAILITIYYWSLSRFSKIGSSVILITAWISFEKFHLIWDFSWPWLNLGNAFSEYIYWIQWYEYTGVFGGSLWILVLNFFFFFQYQKYKEDKSFKKLIRNSIPGLIAIAIPIVLSLIIFVNYTTPEKFSEVIVIQPNIDPYNEKYVLSNDDFSNILFDLSAEEISSETSYIISPETFFSQGSGFDIDTFDNSEFKNSLKEFLNSFEKLNLIIGVQFYKIYRSKKKPTVTANEIRDGFWADFYNSAIQIDTKQKTSINHKSKLVVGVESMPYKSFFKPLLGEFMLDLGGTISSRATQKKRSVFTHTAEGTITAPIICYESIYGEFVTEYALNGAQFFSILTNDAWWGNTQGHKQLLSYARLRAIENRRAIARSANTGISGFIDAQGRIQSSLAYGVKGVLRGSVAINNKLTFYSRYGDYIARLSIFTFFLLLLYAFGKVFHKKK
tara:strand:- start:846 stop:2447 length:1602 start_codon:yes stop_codon:yes gene_type:complete